MWAEFELRAGDRAAVGGRDRRDRALAPGQSAGWRQRRARCSPTRPDDSAGRLIEAAGLKGQRRGSAFVSPKHANFIQADDGGSADDVRALIMEVQRLVDERTGVRLEPELRMVGFDQAGDS